MSYPVVVRLVCWADGQECSGFIKTVDVQQAATNEDWLTTTPHLTEARQWESVEAFHKAYKEVLLSDPVRSDGKPNRPLTALTVVVENVTER